MPRLARTALPLAALVVMVVLPVASADTNGAAPTAQAAARHCHLSAYTQRHLGTTYVLSLSVRGTSCRNGKRVVKAFQACRPGRAGRCHHRVYGYSCGEHRFNKSHFSYDSKVRCAKGSRRVWHTYTQNL
jgi:hypothetical protein